MVHLNCCCVFPVADPAEQRHMYLHLVSETSSLYRHKCLFERLKHFNFTIPNIFLGRDVYFGIAATASIDTNNCRGESSFPSRRFVSSRHRCCPWSNLPPPRDLDNASTHSRCRAASTFPNPVTELESGPVSPPQSRRRRSNHLLELVVLGAQKKYVFVMYILHQAIFRVLFCITYWRCSKGLEVQSG